MFSGGFAGRLQCDCNGIEGAWPNAFGMEKAGGSGQRFRPGRAFRGRSCLKAAAYVLVRHLMLMRFGKPGLSHLMSVEVALVKTMQDLRLDLGGRHIGGVSVLASNEDVAVGDGIADFNFLGHFKLR